MNKIKIIGLSLLGLIVAFVFIFLVFGFSAGFQYVTAPFRGMLEKREQIQASGDFRIFSYNHFYDLCRSIQQKEASYDSQYDLLQDLEKGTKNYERQQRNVAVLKQRIEELKRKYNSDASKEETTAAFKSNDLPERIPVEPYEYGERTKCNF